DAGNWNPSGVPGAIDSLTIVSTANQPIITAATGARAILVQVGATLKINEPSDAFIDVDRIHNQGTLRLTSGYVFATIDNPGAVYADGTAIALGLTNV